MVQKLRVEEGKATGPPQDLFFVGAKKENARGKRGS